MEIFEVEDFVTIVPGFPSFPENPLIGVKDLKVYNK